MQRTLESSTKMVEINSIALFLQDLVDRGFHSKNIELCDEMVGRGGYSGMELCLK